MLSIKSAIYHFFLYAEHMLYVSIAGALSVGLPLSLYESLGSRDTTSMTAIAGIFLLLVWQSIMSTFMIYPFCFLIFGPIAFLVNRYLPLTFNRILVLAIFLTVPATLYVDYLLYLNFDRQTEPYSLRNLEHIGSLLFVCSFIAGFFCALSFWHLRFRKNSRDTSL